MSHTADVAQGHKSRAAEEGRMERMGKGAAHIPPGEGVRSLWVLGDLVTYKISSHKTGRAYSLFEVATQPGTGPPPHIHHREDESFYVLEGDYEFLVEGRTLRVGAASLLYVPKGTLHSHKNVGEGVGRMLVSQTPGGLYEHFFEEVGKPVDGDVGPLAFEEQPDVGRIVEVAAEHGIEIPVPIA
jgi:mannose-6-phosphate isomerase-like protein (cupin superfamily)